jgi:hypothetical protein
VADVIREAILRHAAAGLMAIVFARIMVTLVYGKAQKRAGLLRLGWRSLRYLATLRK